MSDRKLVQRAANPRQYDGPALDWLSVGREASPSGGFFRESIATSLGNLAGRSLLEIGSGTGRLFGLFKSLGTSKIKGVEPSAKSAAVSRQLHPDVPVFEGPFEKFPTEEIFDRVVAVMVFEHIENLNGAFSRIHRCLKPRGEFHLVVGDPECQTNPALYDGIEIEPLDRGALAVCTRRPFGVLCNIVRPLDHFQEAARGAGLTSLRTTSLPATAGLIAKHQSLKILGGQPLCHLLVFARAPEEPRE